MPLSRCGNGTTPSDHPQTSGFFVWRPGRLAYRDALVLQEELIARRCRWPYDLLVLLEHPAVITCGRRRKPQHLHWSPQQLAAAGIDLVETNRGGDVTLHSPGQLVGYPIVDLDNYGRDLHRYLRSLEQVLIGTLEQFGLSGCRQPGTTGVWLGERKIASLGIAVRRWISWHGFALNINNDLTLFDAIVPCGLNGVAMTSMRRELGREIDAAKVSATLTAQFAKVFENPFLGEFSKDHDLPTPTQA